MEQDLRGKVYNRTGKDILDYFSQEQIELLEALADVVFWQEHNNAHRRDDDWS